MRLSELIGSNCRDRSGVRVGRVYDLRLAHGPSGFRVIGVVVGRDRLRSRIAHSWGYAEGRASGPWLLARIAAIGTLESRFVPIERVTDWGPEAVSIDAIWEELDRLGELTGGE